MLPFELGYGDFVKKIEEKSLRNTINAAQKTLWRVINPHPPCKKGPSHDVDFQQAENSVDDALPRR